MDKSFNFTRRLSWFFRQERTTMPESNITGPRQAESSSPHQEQIDGRQPEKTPEFPYYIEQIVYQESNWRGTWILEFKEREEVDWETVVVPSNPGGPPDGFPVKSCWSPSRPSNKWQRDRTGEFAWRLEEIVQEGPSKKWRAIWRLEVKDMGAMDWWIVRVPREDGRGSKYQRKPTKQLPFTPEMQQDVRSVDWHVDDGGQDDLMVWLGKPGH